MNVTTYKLSGEPDALKAQLFEQGEGLRGALGTGRTSRLKLTLEGADDAEKAELSWTPFADHVPTGVVRYDMRVDQAADSVSIGVRMPEGHDDGHIDDLLEGTFSRLGLAWDRDPASPSASKAGAQLESSGGLTTVSGGAESKKKKKKAAPKKKRTKSITQVDISEDGDRFREAQERIDALSSEQRLELAAVATRPDLDVLIRDEDAKVHMTAIKSKQLKQADYLDFATDPLLPRAVVNHMAGTRQVTKNYDLVAALVLNPGLRLRRGTKLLSHLRPAELEKVMNDKAVDPVLARKARELFDNAD